VKSASAAAVSAVTWSNVRGRAARMKAFLMWSKCWPRRSPSRRSAISNNSSLLGVLRLGDEAYDAAIYHEIHSRSGRDVSINAVYTKESCLCASPQKSGWLS
jgi:hypothetical protein